ncbi:MAG: hypothetical protein GXP14_00265 [Gammaproteobacteria bacterium]|nr:hypothetical protein [Gammaproteobacteria bacterium]
MNFEVKAHRVVPRRPFWRAVWTFVVISTLASLAWLLFDYGRTSAGFEIEAALERTARLQQENENLLQAQLSLQEAFTRLEQIRKVEQQAHAKVAAGLADLQSEILELTQQLRFYQGIVSPADIADGVKIKDLKIDRTVEQGRYLYTLILVQGPKRAQRQIGAVSLSLEGQIKGKLQTLSMKQLTDEKRSSHKYRFKYFQRFSGEIKISEGFDPKQVWVQVTPSGQRKKKYEVNYLWADLLGTHVQ